MATGVARKSSPSGCLRLCLIVSLSALLLSTVHAQTVGNCFQGLISRQSTEIVGSDYPMAFTGQFIFFNNESADGSGYRFYSLVLYPVIIPCSIDWIVIHPGSDPVILRANASSTSIVGHASWRKLNPGSQLYLLNATLALAYRDRHGERFNVSAMVERWLAVPVPYVTVTCMERWPRDYYVMAAAQLTKMAQCPTQAEVPSFPDHSHP